MKWLTKMFNLLRHRDSTVNSHEVRLRMAESRVQEIKARGERVTTSLSARHRRNHWTETVQRLARGE